MSGFVHPDRANNNPAFDAKQVMMAHGEFDFGSGMSLPPARYHLNATNDYNHPGFKEEAPFHSGYGSFNGAPTNRASPFRSFARSADRELLDYLHARRVSPYFLNEIDQFLNAHPEIAHYQPTFMEMINYTRPLHAYLFFVKGYTKPARYIDGALPDASSIPLLEDAMPLTQKRDPELTEFFAGYGYRTDILMNIDLDVRGIKDALYHGQRIEMAERKLVILAWYGNLVDAFKYYVGVCVIVSGVTSLSLPVTIAAMANTFLFNQEYNYQTEWLSHRYLPEHVVLSELPKQAGYTEPIPRQLADPGEDCQEDMRSHKATRARMARAADQGVDVIEVLLDDFTAKLARQGLRRNEIERMKQEAIRNIDHQRNIRGSRDIVDMVMNRAKLTNPSDFGRQPPPKVSQRMHRVRGLTHSLRRIIGLEGAMYYDEPSYVRKQITETRQRIERDLVFDVTQLALRGGAMHPKVVQQWRSAYTKAAQVKREQRGQQIDLLTQLAPYL